MKRKFFTVMASLFVMSAFACMLMFTSCDEDKPEENTISVTGVTLNESAASVVIGGENLTLTATVLPENATDKSVTWTSSDNNVATVNQTGLVMAAAAGTATITVTTTDGNKTATCIVTVAEDVIHVESVSLDETELILAADVSATLTATVLPDAAANKNVSWTSSNPAVATVENGTITPVAAGGPITITVTTEDGNKTATCELTVTAAVPVTNITINAAAMVLKVNEKLTLVPVFTPASATNKTVSFVSSNTAVATVDNDGVITALTEGAADISVTPANAVRTVVCKITVSNNSILGCNTDTPGWGESIGTVSFASDQTWTIGNQTWSDAVQTTVCSGRDTYNGGAAGSFTADCRSNPGKKGDLFSWAAVARFQDELCPGDWRVPTSADYVELDKALGGTGTNQNPASHLNKYISDWGGEYHGYCNGINGELFSQASDAPYWALSMANADNGLSMLFKTNRYAGPLSSAYKNIGYALRCVK